MGNRPYESYLIVGEESTWGQAINRSEFKQKIFEFRSAALRNESAPVDSPRLTGHASPIKQVPNFITAGGAVVFDLHADDMAFWWKQILHDDMSDEFVEPSWDEVFGDGMGGGKAWTDPDELDTQPGDLSPSQVPALLKFTFSEGVDQVVGIMGTDVHDNNISETLTFTALGAVTQTTTKAFKTVFAMQFTGVPAGAEDLLIEAGLDSYSDITAPVWKEVFGDGIGGKKAWTDPDNLDTQPGATSPSQSPGLLKFTFSTTVTQTVVITGTDQNDFVITETLTFAAETTHTTTKYFKTVTSIDFTSAPGGGETLIIEASNNLYTHLIEVKDTILDGLTMELIKAGLPNTYLGCLVNTGTLTLGDIATLSFDFMAKRGYDSYVVQTSGHTVGASETPTDVSAFDRVSQEAHPGWEMVLKINDSIVYISSMTFTFGNGLTYPAARYGNSRTMPKPVRGARRAITIEFGIDYNSTQNVWNERFEAGDVVDAKLYAYRTPYEGPEYSTLIDMPECRINAFPDPTVDNFADQLQTISLTPLRSTGATSADELTVTIRCLAEE